MVCRHTDFISREAGLWVVGGRTVLPFGLYLHTGGRSLCLLASQKLTFSLASLVTHLCHKVHHVAKSIQCISYYVFLLPRYYER